MLVLLFEETSVPTCSSMERVSRKLRPQTWVSRKLRPSGCLENSDPKDKTNLDRISRSSVRSYNFQGTSSISFLAI